MFLWDIFDSIELYSDCVFVCGREIKKVRVKNMSPKEREKKKNDGLIFESVYANLIHPNGMYDHFLSSK